MSLTTNHVSTTWKDGARGRARTLSLRVFRMWCPLAWPLGLHIASVLLLLLRIGQHPGFAYNWESDTARGFFAFWVAPSAAIFQLTDGLMTDSGRSPLVVLPVWFGFKVAGVGLASMRIPIALGASLAVPLLWLVGHRLAGSVSGTMATVLLVLSPVYLLYGRTATLVGISLVPALATTYFLTRVLQQSGCWWSLLGLQVLLLAGAYAYAPIRFLWPLSLILLGGELLWRPGQRGWFLVALIVTTLVLPVMLIATDGRRGHSPLEAIGRYYNGRGEQIQALNAHPEDYVFYLRSTSSGQGTSSPHGTPAELAWQLIQQNTRDYIQLLIDRNTLPALSDYWNPQGRLYTKILVPFFLLGFGRTALRARHQVEDRTLLVLFFGFGLPLLLTSQVHIGRLIFAIPFLFLLVGKGFTGAAVGLIGRMSTSLSQSSDATGYLRRGGKAILIAMALTLVMAVGRSTWGDYHNSPLPTREAQIVALLRDSAPSLKQRGGGAVLIVGDTAQLEIEMINTSAYRLALDDRYRFVNLAGNDAQISSFSDPRPPLYFGAVLDHMASIPEACTKVYYIAPALQARFLAAITHESLTCVRPLQYRLLPG